VKLNKFLLITLAVTVLVCGYVYFFTGTKKASPPQVVKALDAATVLAQVRSRSRPGEKRPQPKLDVRWGGDPFELPRVLSRSRADTVQKPLKLVAIVSGKDGRVAIIGTEVVRKGDLVYGEKVEEIGPRGVVLGHGGSKRILVLEDVGIPAPPAAPGNTSIEVGK
jgi:hypothetical protein